MLKREDLIAPKNYNLVNEIEKFSRSKEKNALIWEDQTGGKKVWTYEKLMEETNKIGARLKGLGFEKGDKLIVMVPRVLEAYAVYLAILKAGMVVIPCSEMLRAKDLEYRIKHAEVKGAIVYPSFINAFDEVNTGQLVTLSIGENDAGWKNLLTIEADGDSFQTADTTRED
ncbi:AMP-binding protein, partial [Bacillus velezensis]